MKKNKTPLIVASIILILAVIAAAVFVWFRYEKNIPQTNFHELAEKHVQIIETERNMTSATEGTAKITVTIPDYSAIFADALSDADTQAEFEKKLKKALSKSDIPTASHETTATVTVKDGQTVVNSDEAVKKVLEKTLIDAINAVTEGK